MTAPGLGCVRTGRAPGRMVQKLGAFLVQVRSYVFPPHPENNTHGIGVASSSISCALRDCL